MLVANMEKKLSQNRTLAPVAPNNSMLSCELSQLAGYHSKHMQMYSSMCGGRLQDALGSSQTPQDDFHTTLDQEYGIYDHKKPKRWWDFLQHQGGQQHSSVTVELSSIHTSQ